MNISEFILREETMEQQPMIFARRVGAYGPENAILMERFKAFLQKEGYMQEDSVILGIARDDMRVTPPERLRYDVCMIGHFKNFEHAANHCDDHGDNQCGNHWDSTKEENVSCCDWITQGTTDAGHYVVLEFPHTEEAVSLAWKEAFAYIAGKGYQLDFERSVIERYKKRMVDQHRCEMMVPVVGIGLK